MKKSDKKYNQAIELIKLLEKNSYEARLVGGCVRDRQLGIEPKDYDIGTTAAPQKALSLFKAQGLKVIETGIKYGTITVLKNSIPYEITTLREDVSTDGRWAEVKYGVSFKEDAKRRDFTINALSEDKNGKIYDYFEGLKHLKEKKLYFVGNPETRIKEDYLRILRFFRFRARFKFDSDLSTFKTIKKQANGLERISQERITSELRLIFEQKDLAKTLNELEETNILSTLFPFLKNYKETLKSKELETFFCSLDAVDIHHRFLSRLATFFSILYKEDKDFSSRNYKEKIALLRLSNKEANFLYFLIFGFHKLLNLGDRIWESLEFYDECQSSFHKKFNFNSFLTFSLALVKFLQTIDLEKVQLKLGSIVKIEEKYAYRKKSILVNGRDLETWTDGKVKGKELGILLLAIKRAYLDGEWKEKEEAKKWLDLYRNERSS